MSQCGHCEARLQTNFEECTLCNQCSDRENRCLCCGAYVPPERRERHVPPETTSIERDKRAVMMKMAGEETSAAQAGGESSELAMAQRQFLASRAAGKKSSPVSRSSETRGDMPHMPKQLAGSPVQHDGEDDFDASQNNLRGHSRKGRSSEEPESPENSDDGLDWDMPNELGVPKHNSHKHEGGGASREKTGSIFHKWQHHHDHGSDEDMLLPVPTWEEERRQSVDKEKEKDMIGTPPGSIKGNEGEAKDGQHDDQDTLGTPPGSHSDEHKHGADDHKEAEHKEGEHKDDNDAEHKEGEHKQGEAGHSHNPLTAVSHGLHSMGSHLHMPHLPGRKSTPGSAEPQESGSRDKAAQESEGQPGTAG